jgi:hypothetical protein
MLILCQLLNQWQAEDTFKAGFRVLKSFIGTNQSDRTTPVVLLLLGQHHILVVAEAVFCGPRRLRRQWALAPLRRRSAQPAASLASYGGLFQVSPVKIYRA